jgi:hypothetical protein
MKKKLTLELEDIAVDSFTTDSRMGRRGTVEARSGGTYIDESCGGTCVFTCYPASCASCAFTCDAGCGGTSGNTCGGATCNGTCDYATCPQPETCWLNIC